MPVFYIPNTRGLYRCVAASNWGDILPVCNQDRKEATEKDNSESQTSSADYAPTNRPQARSVSVASEEEHSSSSEETHFGQDTRVQQSNSVEVIERLSHVTETDGGESSAERWRTVTLGGSRQDEGESEHVTTTNAGSA